MNPIYGNPPKYALYLSIKKLINSGEHLSTAKVPRNRLSDYNTSFNTKLTGKMTGAEVTKRLVAKYVELYGAELLNPWIKAALLAGRGPPKPS